MWLLCRYSWVSWVSCFACPMGMPGLCCFQNLYATTGTWCGQHPHKSSVRGIAWPLLLSPCRTCAVHLCALPLQSLAQSLALPLQSLAQSLALPLQSLAAVVDSPSRGAASYLTSFMPPELHGFLCEACVKLLWEYGLTHSQWHYSPLAVRCKG